MKISFTKNFASLLICLSGAAFAETSDSLECAQKALSDAGLTSDQAVKLCVNGGTPKMVECAVKAVREVLLTSDQAVELCANKALRLENMVKFVQ